MNIYTKTVRGRSTRGLLLLLTMFACLSSFRANAQNPLWGIKDYTNLGYFSNTSTYPWTWTSLATLSGGNYNATASIQSGKGIIFNQTTRVFYFVNTTTGALTPLTITNSASIPRSLNYNVATYDPVTSRLFIANENSSYGHIFTVNVAGNSVTFVSEKDFGQSLNSDDWTFMNGKVIGQDNDWMEIWDVVANTYTEQHPVGSTWIGEIQGSWANSDGTIGFYGENNNIWKYNIVTNTTTLVGTSSTSFVNGGEPNDLANLYIGVTVSPLVGGIGMPYTGAVAGVGGTSPYTYALTSGTLPPGLSFNTSTGAITGTPTTIGSYPLTFQVTDSNTPTNLTSTTSVVMVIGVDSDGDGVFDDVDIDDDNDGIPDKVENQCPTLATWTDWTSVSANTSATGTLPLSSGNVTVTYTSPQVYSIQQPGYFNIGDIYSGMMPASGTEGLQALHGAGTTHTYTFSQPVKDPIFVFWSMNGNTFTFDKNFIIVGKTAGITSTATSITGSSAVECNTTIQFIGTFTSISYTSSLLENWTGVTVGIQQCQHGLDSDGDGTANILDLDSDGDSCSDAFEGGATSDKTTNFKFMGVVGTNGLVDILETTADNNVVSYTSKYNTFALNNTNIRCNLKAPGGVINDLEFWYKPDAGITLNTGKVSSWVDQINGIEVTPATATKGPIYFNSGTNLINFNPTLNFTNTTREDGLRTNIGLSAISTGVSTFSVLQPTDAASRWFLQWGVSGAGYYNNYGACSTDNPGVWTNSHAGCVNAPTTLGPITTPSFVSSRWNNTTGTNQWQLRKNGQLHSGTTTSTTLNVPSNTALEIGDVNQRTAGNEYVGNISEVMGYTSRLSDVDRQKVESYISIKYGITYMNDANTDARDYLTSAGTTIWSATTNAGYNNNIAAIGRDDDSALNQKQSKSVNAGFQPVIANGTGVAATNAVNTNTFLADKSFDIIGDNGASANYSVAFSPTSFTPASAFFRMNRIWKVQETGTVGTVTIRVPTGAERLLVSSTSAFTPGAGTQEIALTSDGAGNVTAQVDFTNGQFFTFGRVATGPGGVVSMAWWFEGDQGLKTSGSAVTQWEDQSLNGLDVTQATTSKQPTSTSYQNFNPVVTYTGNKALLNAAGYWKSSTNNTQYNVFAVAKHTTGTGSVNTLFAEGTSAVGPQTLHYEYGGNMYMGFWGGYSAYTPFTPATYSGIPLVISSRYNTTGNVKQLYKNGQAQTMTGYNNGTLAGTFNGSNSALAIGNSTDQVSWPFEGDIAEIVMYPTDLTATQRQQVESYLALKWGTTLDQTTAYNYLNSAGAIIWDATANSGFKSDITGIGTDAASGLNQKQSKTVNSTGYVTLALGSSVATTNAANTANFTADKSYEIIGDNGLAARFANAYTPSFPTNNLFYYSMSRVWKVQETGTVGTITLSIPFRNNNTYLLIKNSSTFGSGATEVLMVKDGKGNLTATVDLIDGQYFTFASAQTAPGAVVSGLSTWLKADAGVIDAGSIPADGAGVDSWNDQSFTASGYSVSQSIAARQPFYYAKDSAKLVNFNPSLYFNGGQVLTNSNAIFAGTSPFSFMMVGVDESTNTGYHKIFGAESVADYFGLYKVSGATSNNGWSLYTAGNNDVKGTGYAPTGGSSGYWNGTAFVADNKMKRIQPQIIGISSANPVNTNPSTFKSTIDGYASTGTFNGNSVVQTYFAQSLTIGAEASLVEPWIGRVPEFVAYNKQLTDAETQRVNTYMAIKYGITLGQGGSLTGIGNNAANYDYIATDGTTKVWDATANSTYKYDITGIGRDDAEALDQEQSKSMNASVYVTMALGGAVAATNAENTSSFTADKSYEIFGDNGLAVTNATVYVPSSFTPSAPFYLLSRVWKVQETGTVGTVTLSIPASGGQERLIVSNTAAFTPGAGTQEIVLSPDGNGNLTAQVDFTNGQFFTFGRSLIAPGGVVSDLNMWLKADALTGTNGSKVTTWSDSYLSTYTVDQTTTSQQPILYTSSPTNLVNFNPSVKFDNSASQILKNTTASPLTSTGISFHFIAVGKDQEPYNIASPNYGNSRIRALLGNGASGDNPAMDLQKDGVAPNGWNPWSSLVGEYSGGKATMYNGGGVGNASGTATMVLPSASVGRLINQQPQIYGLGYTEGAATKINGWIDGFTEATNLTDNNAAYTGGNYFALGHSGGGEYWNGTINEVLAYGRELTTLEMQKVNTYLAIKYGTTLGQGNGNVGLNTGYNYVATDGVTNLWNTTTNTGYNYDIAVIGRDDAEALNQKQSQSVNSGVQPTIGLGTIAVSNQANTNTFGSDKDFEAWGSNGLGAGYSTAFTPTTFTPVFPFKRMDRAWKVQETGTVGTVTVKINSNADYLLVDTDGDGNFATGTIIEVLLTNRQANYDFKTGDVFTFGREIVVQTCDKGLAFIHGDDAAGSSNSSALGMSAWVSNGDGTFKTTPIVRTGFNRDNTGTEVFGQDAFSATYTADMDNDGDKDLVHVTENNSNSIYVYLNNGDGTFQTTPIVTTGMQAATNSIFAGEDGAQQGWMGDANGDGNIDYIFSGDDKQVHVYLGNGDGTFALTRISSTLTANGYNTSGISASESFLVADVNNDGSVDLIGSFDPQHITVWLGNGDGTFQSFPYFDSDIQDTGGSNSSGSAGSEYSQFADVDGDGDLDYVHAESYDSTPQIWAYLNNGDGTFTTTAVVTQASTTPGNDMGKFANYTGSRLSYFADVNSDGKADFVTTVDDGGASVNGIYVYLATSNGSFAVTPVATVIPTGFATGSNSTETSFIACGVILCNAGTTAPSVPATKTNVCPATTVNLSLVIPANKPSGVVTTWHTATPATLSNRVADSTAVGAGTYYAAFLDKANDCMSPTSTALTVTITSPCPATFTFNCASASATGTFTANGSSGQTGTLTVPLTSATAGTATFTVTGTGFSGTLSTTLTAGQTSVSVPITYDGTGASGSRTLTVSSTGGTGTCPPLVSVTAASATYTFNCGSASATGTFTANGTSGQTGSLTINLTGATAGAATFTVTGTGFTGTLSTTLTVGQTSVVIPITYDGTGTSGSRTLTVTGTGSTGTCTPSVSVICGAGAAVPNLASTTISNTCPVVNANLTSIAVGNKPSGSVMTWHTGTPATSANKVPDSTSVAAGTYYAAFYNVAQACYGGTTSGAATTAVTVTLDVCPADISVSNVCPSNTVDLTTRINSTVPAGKVVTWHTGLPTTTANKVGNPAAVTNGTYYAAFYDSANDCYSPGSSNGIVVSITLCQTSRSGVVPPTLSATTLGNVCPTTVADLSTLVASNTPVGTTLTWHSGSTADNTNIISSITAVGSGTYYAAFYDDLANTYSPTTAVTVTITTCVTCEAGYAKPELSVTTKSNTCPATTANLGTITSSYLPVGTTLSWHSATPATLANKVPDSSAVAAGTYYAAFYDKVNGCFSGNGDSTTAVVVTINSCSTPDLITTIGQPTPALVAGQVSNLPVKVTNIGGVSATGPITTTVTLPTGVSAPATFITNSSACTTSGQTITCVNVGSIAANDSIVMDIPITPNVSLIGTTPIFNATVASVSGETNMSNNTATPTTAATPVTAVVKVSAKVFLSGSYVTSTGMMHDSLRVKGLIPTAQPYGSIGYTGTETVAPSVLTVTGANAIVDWVLVELRSNATTVVVKRAGLVQRDGDIVDVDGISPLSFAASSGSYYVVVRHRNHLGVMSGSAIALTPTTTTVDFTSLLTTNYQITGSFGNIYAQRTLGTVRGLWGGNSGGGVSIKATGSGSDAEAIYFKVLLDAGNTSFSPSYIIYNTYSREDATMDGKIIYQGTNSEVDGILFNVLLHLNNTGVLPTFVIYEQIP